MKILLTQETDWLTRGPHHQHQLIDRLSLRGHQVRVIDYDINWQKKGIGISKREIFLKVHRVKDDATVYVVRPGMIRFPILNYISTWVTNFFEIRRQMKEFKPDVVIGMGILNADLSVLFCHQYKTPFVYFWMDLLHLLIPLKPMRWFGKFVEEETLKFSNKVVVINNSLWSYVLAHGANDIAMVTGGVDLKTFKPTNLKIREQYGVKPNELLLFFMGYVYAFSGLEEVARQLKDYKDVKLMVVGDGESFGGLNRIRDELQLGDKLITVDKKPYSEIPNYIYAADVCILPSEVNDTMKYIVPIKIYEYMALGKPIIATRLPGVVEEFGDGNGISYVDEPADVVPMAKWIKDNCIIGRGLQSAKYIKNKDWDKLTDEFEQILKEVKWA